MASEGPSEETVASLMPGQGLLGPGHRAWREDGKQRTPWEVLSAVCPPTAVPEKSRGTKLCGRAWSGTRARHPHGIHSTNGTAPGVLRGAGGLEFQLRHQDELLPLSELIPKVI